MSVASNDSAPATPGEVAPGGRRQRADARRNRQRLVEEATRAFLAEGVEASLDDIARRAGVGPGTLYRHFPSREALLGAAVEERKAARLLEAEDLAVAADPGEALREWLESTVVHVAEFRGFGAALLAARGPGCSALQGSCEELTAATSRLLGRAQDAGVVRADVGAVDLLNLASAIGGVMERTVDDGDDARRLLALAWDGLTATLP